MTMIGQRRRHILFAVKDDTTPDEIDAKFAKAYENATPDSLVFIFDLTRLNSLTWDQLTGLAPLISKYRENAKTCVVESNIVIESAWVRGLIETFLALPFVSPASPVHLRASVEDMERALVSGEG